MDPNSPAGYIEYLTFIRAVQNGNMEEVDAHLTEHPEFVDRPDNTTPEPLKRTALHYAAKKGDPSMMGLLLHFARQGRVSIDIPDVYGMTPFHFAAKYGRDSIVELLLQHGSASSNGAVRIDSCCDGGRTALHLAAANGHDSTVELLLERGGICIDSRCNAGNTPLHYAATNGNNSTIELLLRRGSTSIDSRCSYGRTPLHRAASNGRDSTVILLLQRGSTSIDALSHHGWTPLNLAVWCLAHRIRKYSTLKILKAAGAAIIPFHHSIDEKFQTLLHEPVPEDEIAEIRFRIYFSQSLLARLLC